MSEPAFDAFETGLSLKAPGRGMRRIVDAAIVRLLSSSFTPRCRGHLLVTLPSGLTVLLGRGGGIEASLQLSSYRPLYQAGRRGLLGIAEAYMSGELDTADLGDLFRFFLENEALLTAALPHLAQTADRDRSYHARRGNTRAGSRRNIAAHYDLGNDFYRLWLDREMSYSSAIWTRAEMTLEEAQAAKHDRILAALDLQPGHRVLEIGCGWGALAEAIAARCEHVTAITISKAQLEATRAKLESSPYRSRAEAAFLDYRDVTASFDRIVSIEMIEAVGECNWPAYFRTIAERLNAGGQAVIQAITVCEDLYDGYRQNPDFIQRYIFPGGMLPTPGIIEREARLAGLEVEHMEQFGQSYARTLVEWRRRFLEAWPRVEAQGFDARFRRMWLYYLTYCEVGFECGTIDVGLYRLRKP